MCNKTGLIGGRSEITPHAVVRAARGASREGGLSRVNTMWGEQQVQGDGKQSYGQLLGRQVEGGATT